MYFTHTDFAAFDPAKAQSSLQADIKARQDVIELKLKPLHDDGKCGGLGPHLRTRRLFPHWQSQHLTNVIWPFGGANGGWVDYLRLGYGKEHALVKEFAKRANTTDAMAFYWVTQLQILLYHDGWWVGLYIDKKGWLEIKNIYAKVSGSRTQRAKAIDLMDNLCRVGYSLVIYPHNGGDWKAADGTVFLSELEDRLKHGEYFSVSVHRHHEIVAPENNASTLIDYLKGEFDRLYPLYEFASWHPKANNHLGI